MFAVFGIAAAALSTQLFLPALAGRDRKTTRIADWVASRLNTIWFGENRSRVLLAVPLILVTALAAVGLPQLRWNDGIADLNRVDPALQAQDQAVRDRVMRFEQQRLVVATGATEELALQANDEIQGALRQLQTEGGLVGFRSLAPMLPSAKTQAAVGGAIRSDPRLWQRLEQAFASEQFIASHFQPWRDFVAEDAPEPLTFGELAASPLGAMVQPFRFTWSGGIFVMCNICLTTF